jgi:hypothetical protein
MSMNVNTPGETGYSLALDWLQLQVLLEISSEEEDKKKIFLLEAFLRYLDLHIRQVIQTLAV